MMRHAIDATTLHTIRRALIAALAAIEDALGLEDGQRVTTRRKGVIPNGS